MEHVRQRSKSTATQKENVGQTNRSSAQRTAATGPQPLIHQLPLHLPEDAAGFVAAMQEDPGTFRQIYTLLNQSQLSATSNIGSLSSYEQGRFVQMWRNQKQLEALGLSTAQQDLRESTQCGDADAFRPHQKVHREKERSSERLNKSVKVQGQHLYGFDKEIEVLIPEFEFPEEEEAACTSPLQRQQEGAVKRGSRKGGSKKGDSKNGDSKKGDSKKRGSKSQGSEKGGRGKAGMRSKRQQQSSHTATRKH